MLHLAQVQKQETSGEAGLCLLACQRSDSIWSMLTATTVVATPAAQAWGHGVLVLAELTDTNQVVEIKDAKDWIVDLVQSYLVAGITPAFLKQEAERAEHWRQMLTLQSQELDRRALELEARLETVQELEETLKREKKQLEEMAAQTKLKLNQSN